MPNVKGGKGYKKGKHGGDTEAKMIDWQPSEGQMLGRVMKSLGNRRFKVYCNDNKERTCKLCGSTRKSEWVAEGSIVLVGIREIGTSTTTSNGGEVGDILNLVDTRLYGKLKKVEGVNILLFSHLEKEDSEEVRRRAKLQEAGQAVDDDLFDRDDEEEEDEEEEDSDEEGLNEEEKKKLRSLKREEKNKKRDQKIAKQRATKQEGGGRERSDSIDIDKI